MTKDEGVVEVGYRVRDRCKALGVVKVILRNKRLSMNEKSCV